MLGCREGTGILRRRGAPAAGAADSLTARSLSGGAQTRDFGRVILAAVFPPPATGGMQNVTQREAAERTRDRGRVMMVEPGGFRTDWAGRSAN